MNPRFPLVSVIIPAYNAENFINYTLASVISQTYRNVEILIIDDGSQDRTAEIVKYVAAQDSRVKLLQQQNAGVAAARNLGIQKSSGEYIAPIDADDIWYPQKLEKQVQCMLQADESVGLVYAWSVDIDKDGLLTGGFDAPTLEGEVYMALVYGNFLGSASVPLIRRSCLNQVGYYNCQLRENNAQGYEDGDLYLRIAELYQFRAVPEFLVGYRKTVSSMSCNYTSMANSYLMVLADVKQRHPEIPATIYCWSTSNFYMYLACESKRCGSHSSTLFWLYKALRVDPLNLLRFQIYSMSIKSCLNLIAQSITSLFWKGYPSSIQINQQLGSNHQAIKIADLNKEITKPRPPSWKPYDRVLLQRWNRVVQHCQLIHS